MKSLRQRYSKDYDALTKEEKEWEYQKPILLKKEQIRKEKREIKSRIKLKLTTTKRLIVFLFVNCSFVELFTAWAIVKNLHLAEIAQVPIDFSPLTALIGAVVSEVVGFAIYALKSSRENQQGGITYDMAMSDVKEENVE